MRPPLTPPASCAMPAAAALDALSAAAEAEMSEPSAAADDELR